MGRASGGRRRRVFQWPEEARKYAIECHEHLGNIGGHGEFERKQMVARLEELSGNPRGACLRFLRKLGAAHKRSYRPWTKPEQQRLIDLIDGVPVEEAALILGRSASSVRAMLHRLELGARQLREWFTTSLLAQALHISREEVQRWIDRGWLPRRVVQTHGLKIQIIDADDFCVFIEKYGRQVVGHRLKYEGLLFVRNYVFPAKHSDLLDVRGTYKKSAKSAEINTAGADGPHSEATEEKSIEGRST